MQIANAAPAEAVLAEALTDPAAMAAFRTGEVYPAPTASDAALEQAAREIIRATAKPTDGMIARHINRP